MADTPHCAQCPARAGGLFGRLTAGQLDRLVAVRLAHTYEPGRPAYYEGTPALAVLCIGEGRFKLWRAMPNGDQHVVAIRGRGDLLGYRAVLAGRPYAVTAEPLERSVACTIPRETFMALVGENAAFTCGLLMRLAADSLDSEDRLVARALDNVRRRTARYLVHNLPEDAESAPRPLRLRQPFGHREMARLIGTTPETLSRTLHAFAARGILGLEHGDIQVLDLAALRRLAQKGGGSDLRTGAPPART